MGRTCGLGGSEVRRKESKVIQISKWETGMIGWHELNGNPEAGLSG